MSAQTINNNVSGLLQIFCFLIMAGIAFVSYSFGAAAHRIYFIFFTSVCLVGVIVWWRQRSSVTAILILIYLTIAIGWPLFGQSPLAKYQRFLRNVSVGMSSNEVVSLFGKYFPAYQVNGKPAIRMYKDWISFTLDPDSADYNAEMISLEIRNGHVTKKNYYGD